ncbi:phosphocholine-specific phospholipase C [Flavihumibacter fluvii]|uniref:phosphocholine-specific phospholipase C n=1 Tax=Flavihumibacter fluvii TaxID=2838157 RepID=UPI001BDEE43B|nr:phospholipase C, phosphocholine-specific [Flavihumibacter fluvii]ULQ52724.1 phospholipase C, phosphocholine-specific [Flavihumibacter fluvii]
MDNRREFLKQASILAGGAGMLNILPMSIQKALAINPAPGSTYMDAEHIVILMQENRSFDHTYGTLKGVRGFNDPRAIFLPNKNPVWLQTNKAGETFAPFHLDIKDTKATWMSSLPHSWSNQVDARNNGKYDKWLDAKPSGNKAYSSMPLTMGYYTRQDIPFYYALADAFTVCDQNFCSALTGTTPNRLYFWSGTIREKLQADVLARVWNGDADYDNWANWKTFPERLEENDISWKVYQNEISVGVGLEGEEDSWLANFTDNPLEFYAQYQVKLSPGYIANLPKSAQLAADEINKMELALQTASSENAAALQKKIAAYKQYMVRNADEQKLYTQEKFNQLTATEKSIHEKAFTTNKKDPHYHELTPLRYMDGKTEREVLVPKGDVLFQFREDVTNGQLPTVSWIVAPENFSDHPGAAWYGAWYISEVMDILTKNPEVWKKTIFILAYDENDGYFDHVPPFTVPNPYKEGTGLTSGGIDTSLEFVTKKQQSSSPKDSRESPIGLGFRVPLVIASPWSRGGYVCSEVFDHTSTLQFLEKFLNTKYGKQISETNITSWRRAICGDLSSSFQPFHGEKINTPSSLKRNEVVENIHKAKFKGLPANFKKLSAEEIESFNKNPYAMPFMARQEKGTKPSCAIPYEMYVDGLLSADKKTFEVQFRSGNQVFGSRTAGAAFNVYAPGKYNDETADNRAYTVIPGDSLIDNWQMSKFENGHYHLRIYGVNGFFREFSGHGNDPELVIKCTYESIKNRFTGNIVLTIQNKSGKTQEIDIEDNSYKSPAIHKKIDANNSATSIILNLSKNGYWYDFTVAIRNNPLFMARYAGHVETGETSISDPAMGYI